MRYLVTAIVTAAICWLMFRYSFRVERVYDAGDVVLVEVAILGQCEIHEVTKEPPSGEGSATGRNPSRPRRHKVAKLYW